MTPNVVSHWIWTIKESFYLFELSFKIGYSNLFKKFAGMKGWKIYAGFQSCKMIYLHYALQKCWHPELSYFLVVLNTAAMEGVSVRKRRLTRGINFLQSTRFTLKKTGAKHLNPSFSASYLTGSVCCSGAIRACPSNPIRKN